MAQRSSAYVDTVPYWSATASLPHSPTIERDRDVDVIVVGGGITGLTTAYLLASEGHSVALLERGRCADIDTGHTTAHLTMATDVRLNNLADTFGKTHAQAVWDAGLGAIAQIARIVQDHDIECAFEWVDGYLHTPEGMASEQEAKTFRTDAALANEMGFDAAFVEAVPFIGGPGVRFDDQARFHPRKYLAGLVTALRAKGAEIYERSSADEFSDRPLGVKSSGHLVRCKDIVIATHNPLAGIAGSTSAALFQTKLALYTSYVVAGRVAHGRVHDALFFDSGDPYHYLRLDPHPDHDLVIFGGEDHKTGQVMDTSACYDRLERTLRQQIPEIDFTYRWSGQVIDTLDRLPYIGEMTDHQYAATGFGGNGMTFGTLAGMIITDAIQGRTNPWADLFDPGRRALLRGAWDYVKENADYPYYMLRTRLASAESRSLKSVKRGQGEVIDHHGQKVAAYRDLTGALTLRSAICTHMGCVVAWNTAERTWDCPCHGSRFAPHGDPISGPAASPLPDIEQ